MNIDEWSPEDWQAWESMSDSDRRAWEEYHVANPEKQVSPSKWCDPKHKVRGWDFA